VTTSTPPEHVGGRSRSHRRRHHRVLHQCCTTAAQFDSGAGRPGLRRNLPLGPGGDGAAMPDTFQITYPSIVGHEWSGEIVTSAPTRQISNSTRRPGYRSSRARRQRVVRRHPGWRHGGRLRRCAGRLPPPQPGAILISAALDEPFSCVLAALNKAGAVSASQRVHVYVLGRIALCAVGPASLHIRTDSR
jgi:hypothetical protein